MKRAKDYDTKNGTNISASLIDPYRFSGSIINAKDKTNIDAELTKAVNSLPIEDIKVLTGSDTFKRTKKLNPEDVEKAATNYMDLNGGRLVDAFRTQQEMNGNIYSPDEAYKKIKQVYSDRLAKRVIEQEGKIGGGFQMSIGGGGATSKTNYFNSKW